MDCNSLVWLFEAAEDESAIEGETAACVLIGFFLEEFHFGGSDLEAVGHQEPADILTEGAGCQRALIMIPVIDLIRQKMIGVHATLGPTGR